MNNAIRVLISVAEELAELARSSVPKMRQGEYIQREWLEDGIYYRQSVFNDEIILTRFDFRKRKAF